MKKEGVHHSRDRLELEGAQLVAALLEVLEVVLEVRKAVDMLHELVVAQVLGLFRNAHVDFVETFAFLFDQGPLLRDCPEVRLRRIVNHLRHLRQRLHKITVRLSATDLIMDVLEYGYLCSTSTEIVGNADVLSFDSFIQLRV